MNFKQTSYDPDVWWRKYDEKNNEYIGTHTDDLLVISKDAKSIMDNLQKVYSIKNVEEPKYHLGVDYRKDEKGTWYMGTVTHTQEALKKVATTFGISTELVGGPENRQYLKAMGKDKTPMDEKLKPELDSSKLLDAPGHRNYQRLIGIGQWLLTIGRYCNIFSQQVLCCTKRRTPEGSSSSLQIPQCKPMQVHQD
jgi:hypothetical protein